MGRRAKSEEEGTEVKGTDARESESEEDCDEIVAKRRKPLPSRKAATIHASPVDSKGMRNFRKRLRVVRDSIAFRVKRDKKLSVMGKSRRYDDEDNKFFLTEMLKLAASGIDGHDCIRNSNVRKLYVQVRKRFGNHYSQRQVYEKARRLRRWYMKLLTKSADQRATPENSSKEEIFSLCHQLWGDCGVLKLHLEADDGPVCANERMRDAAGGRDHDLQGHEGVVLGRDIEINKGAHADVNDSVPIVSSIHQDDSHGLKGVNVPDKDMAVDKTTPAEVDDHVPSAKDTHVCLLKDLAEKPGDEGTELATQMLDEVIHKHNQGLLQALGRKCDSVLEGMQARLMSMVSSALEARDEASMGRIFDMLKPAGILHDDKFVEGVLTGSMHENNLAVPKHLQDRLQRLRVEELKLVSDRLRLMLEVCQNEQAKLERQIRHS